jgi:hypothetical protein
MLNIRLWVALGVAMLVLDAARAAAPTSPAKARSRPRTAVVHSPYARAAAAHSATQAPGTPIKGHNATMVQGQGMSAARGHSSGMPH